MTSTKTTGAPQIADPLVHVLALRSVEVRKVNIGQMEEREHLSVARYSETAKYRAGADALRRLRFRVVGEARGARVTLLLPWKP